MSSLGLPSLSFFVSLAIIPQAPHCSPVMVRRGASRRQAQIIQVSLVSQAPEEVGSLGVTTVTVTAAITTNHDACTSGGSHKYNIV
ncbi:hypothetical protein Pmani_023669 [Petrolisthes manimaculis]|uniref:Secreted protein n=1 Tax=Petrolisthes manimaculis TaxID=1843537 RepID=A0AAE1U345_9EUCA|nr:hypothetical protein Pmani_023669 [Petrolisthes manimaculis]